MSTQLCFTNKNARKKVCFDICHTCLDLFLTNVALFSNNCVFEVKSEVLALKNNQSLFVSFYVKIVALYTWQIWAVIFGCSESGAVNYSTLLLDYLPFWWPGEALVEAPRRNKSAWGAQFRGLVGPMRCWAKERAVTNSSSSSEEIALVPLSKVTNCTQAV